MAITTGMADSARCGPRCCNSDSHVGSWRGMDSRKGHPSRTGRNAQGHPVWNAHLEVYGEIHGLNCTLWKSWPQCDVNKSPGIRAANSEFLVGLNFTIESTQPLVLFDLRFNADDGDPVTVRRKRWPRAETRGCRDGRASPWLRNCELEGDVHGGSGSTRRRRRFEWSSTSTEDSWFNGGAMIRGSVAKQSDRDEVSHGGRARAGTRGRRRTDDTSGTSSRRSSATKEIWTLGEGSTAVSNHTLSKVATRKTTK
ncbi:hypothetical protein F2Q69_00021897 [Brassica cretica]|uniref:Uncharacterized protein n=1 Tax=Brassica cretica TaxID=69181 RepID=A0A8S9QL29_BRACR|nr:hypothetical protein F2Q69_00021897 [Brassica cretica]